MKIFVSGGSGFIGTILTSELLEAGHQVTIYDRQISKAFPELCIFGDIRDREKLIRSMSKVEVVYHLAAEHHDNIRPISLYHDVNVGGAQNIINAMEKNCVNKLIYTSTAAVYGINSGEKNEDNPPKPFNEYGKSKYEAERAFNSWADRDTLRNLITVRPAVIFGEGNRGNVYNLLYLVASGKFIMVGSGTNKKSMGYVRNLTAFLKYLLNYDSGKFVYNYADKPDLSVNELVKITKGALEKEAKINFKIPYLAGLLGGYFFDLLSKITMKKYAISSIRIKKFCSETIISTDKLMAAGFSPPYSLPNGLIRTILNEFSPDV